MYDDAYADVTKFKSKNDAELKKIKEEESSKKTQIKIRKNWYSNTMMPE